MFSSSFSTRVCTWPSFEGAFQMLDEATQHLEEATRHPTRFHTEKAESGHPTRFRTEKADSGVLLIGEVPGHGPEDLTVGVEKRRLMVEGTLKGSEFKRCFTLNNVDLKKVTATVKNGLLTVTLPSSVPKQKVRREIKVQAG